MPTATLPDFIRTNVDAIVSRWEALSQAMCSVQQTKRTALQDHAKRILLGIAADLEHPHATIHSHDRLSAEFRKDESMLELRALQASAMQLWSESAPTEAKSARAEETRFNEAIDRAISELLKRPARLFDALLSASPDLNFILDTGGHFLYANKATVVLLRSTVQGLVGKNVIALGLPRSDALQQILQGVMHTRESHRGEISLSPSADDEAVFDLLFEPIFNGDGALDAIAVTGRNVTQRKATEEETMRRANYDFLTGLPNRSYFLNYLGQDIQRAGRSGLSIALLYMDLDGFKKVNDRHGLDAGNQLLQQVTQRISRCVRGTDTVARLGGDQFAVILTDVSKILHVEILAQEMLGGLTQPFSVQGANVEITAHMGITFFPQDASTPDELLKNAGQAMYVAKSAGRSCFSYFKVAMRDAAWARRKVIGELRRALPLGELAVFYQPIVALADATIVKAEALLRWRHPTSGLLVPNDFIGLAEETGLIGEIGEWVLNDAMQCAKEWSTLLGRPFQISVNKSPVELMSRMPMQDWDTRLKGLALPRNCLSIEITEETLTNGSPHVREKLDYLRKAGVQLSINNFGTGHSSMLELKRLNVDFLKMDMSFVQELATNGDSRSIAEAIIAMAHKLGLKVIAEGVETAEQRDWLKEAQCDYAQGYLFSPPISSLELGRLLQAGKTSPPVLP